MYYDPDATKAKLPKGSELSFIEKLNLKSIKEFFDKPKIPLTTPIGAPEFDLFASNYFRTLDTQDPTGEKGLIEKRQRTPWWFKAREGQLTGSKQANAIGFFGLDGLLKTWYETYRPQEVEKQDAKQTIKMKESMAWGSNAEQSAVATIAKHFGPQGTTFEECILTPAVIRPELETIIYDSWTKVLKKPWNEKWKKIWYHFLSTSPDIKAFTINGLRLVWEIKAPYGIRNPQVYSYVPWYYVGQMQLHMLAENLDGCYFAAWDPKTTRIWYVEFNAEYWKEAMPLLMDFHLHGLNDTPPTKLFDPARTERCKKICKQEHQFLGSIPSVYCKRTEEELEYWEGWVTEVQLHLDLPRLVAKQIALYCQLTDEERQASRELLDSLDFLDFEVARLVVHFVYI